MSSIPSRSTLLAELAPADRAAERVLCLGHAIKEIMTPRLAKTALEMGVRLAEARIIESSCISDGGDGFLEVCQQVMKLAPAEFVAHGPLGRITVAPAGVDRTRAVGAVEMALVCGLRLVPPAQRDIIHSGTAGMGDVLYRMISSGVREIHVGVGGSATCDGGAGMLMRLQQLLFADPAQGRNGKAHYTVEDMAEERFPNVMPIRERLESLGVRLSVYSDVQSPLLGPKGAAQLFAPQKGASVEDVEILESVMERWADELERQTGRRLRDLPGAGAAGGIGMAFAALGFPPKDGASALFEQIELDRRLADCDLVMTCEGRFDASSLAGKAPWKAALRAREAGKRAIILCGAKDRNAEEEAARQGIRVVEFARNLPEGRRAAESFSRLSETVRLILKGLA